MKRFHLPLILLLAVAVTFTACSDDDGNSPATTATVALSLTDAPADYEAVHITFSEVALSMNGGWVVLSGETQTIDLLEWNNGKSIELGRQDVDPGKITQIRLMVTEATVTVDGEIHDVTIPSAEQTGLKLVTNFDLVAGSTYEFVVDFDANASIVTTGNPQKPNGYKLKPTLRVEEKATTGSISGIVANFTGTPQAFAMQNGGAVTSTPIDVSTGAFRLAYLAPGTYSVEIVDGTAMVSKEDVVVSAGQDNDIGTLSY